MWGGAVWIRKRSDTCLGQEDKLALDHLVRKFPELGKRVRAKTLLRLSQLLHSRAVAHSHWCASSAACAKPGSYG